MLNVGLRRIEILNMLKIIEDVKVLPFLKGKRSDSDITFKDHTIFLQVH